MRILVVRNDRLGDFMLAWPVFALLKQHRPDWHISALVPDYTAPMARLCPWIDDIVIDTSNLQGLKGIIALANMLHHGHFDALLTLFSTGRVAVSGCFSRIPYRLAPASKLAQFCYNHRMIQRRSHSDKPEYAYNLDLAYRLLKDLGLIKYACLTTAGSDKDYLPNSLKRPLLEFNHVEIMQIRARICNKHQFPQNAKLIYIHPGSGGSANNLHLEQYAALAHNLESSGHLAFIITAGPGEIESAQALAKLLAPLHTLVLDPGGGLVELAKNIAFADLFISNSTGPLHIAGALNRYTATFYPRHRSGSPLRWQPLNSPNKRLAFTPADDADPKDVSSIDVYAAAEVISQRFLS